MDAEDHKRTLSSRLMVHHGPRRVPVELRIWPRIKPDPSGCWLWTGSTNGRGYACIMSGAANESTIVHRWVYEQLIGPIPEGLQIDHLCRVHNCVNPTHLEPVTGQENNARGFSPSALNARKTHCLNGHLLDGDNLYLWEGTRLCKACQAQRDREFNARLKAQGLTARGTIPKPPRHPTHCVNGHEFTPDNTLQKSNRSGPYRACRICVNQHAREKNARDKFYGRGRYAQNQQASSEVA